MKITRKDVVYVAALAHLELTAEEGERMQQQLDSILTYIDKLNEIDTNQVEPMAQVLAPPMAGLAESHPEVAVRGDERQPGLDRREALGAAPDADPAFVRVPKVIER